MEEINIINENLKEYPLLRDKLIFQIIKQIIIESSFDELNSIFDLISKSNYLKKTSKIHIYTIQENADTSYGIC